MAVDASAASGGAVTSTFERRLGVRKRARADAAAGRPPADEPGPCAFETEIAMALGAELERVLAERRQIAQSLEQTLRRLRAPAPDFSLFAAQALLPLHQAEARQRSELASLRSRAQAERADVETFRRREDRVFGAKLPDSSLLSTGLLVVLMAVEAVASAPIFANTNGTGLVNGYLTAAVMGALNAVTGLLGGFFGVRYTTHSKPALKVLGYGAALLSVATAIGFNLFMALWRATSEAPPDSADATPPLALLATGPSITLVMLGAIVFLMSLYEGATRFGEPYPEYGKMERHAQAAEEEFRDALDDVIEELHELVEPAIAGANARLDAMQAKTAQMVDAFDDAAARLMALDAQHRILCSVQTALIVLYRTENAGARKGAAPKSFLIPPVAPEPPPELLERAGALLTEAKESFSHAQSAANTEIGVLIREIKDISDRLEGVRP